MTSPWRPAYVALGSNLDDPVAQIQRAAQALRRIPLTNFYLLSRLYRTAPMGPRDQPDFVNAAAAVLTRLEPREFLNELLRIEREMGRERGAAALRWGPRIIDLDLLAMNALVVDEPGLQLPHPGVSERNFVLYPLRDIAPELVIPRHGRICELAARASSEGIVPIE